MIEQIRRLIEHLKEGTNTKAGFYAAIKVVEDRAQYLEETVLHLQTANRELREANAISLPSFTSTTTEDFDLVHDITLISIKLNTRIPEYRIALSNEQARILKEGRANKLYKHLLTSTYRNISKELRKNLRESLDQLMI